MLVELDFPMKRLVSKTNSGSPLWVAPPVPQPTVCVKQRWTYDNSKPELSFAPGFSKIDVLRGFAKLFALRGTVSSRSEYADKAALLFEQDSFLWSDKSIGEVAKTFLIVDEYVGVTSVVQDRIMKVAPKKKRWQLAYVMGIFCTRDAAVAIETCWEELGRKRSNLDAAATIIDHV